MFEGIWGNKICRIWAYGLGDMIFRSLGTFLEINYGIIFDLPRVLVLLVDTPTFF